DSRETINYMHTRPWNTLRQMLENNSSGDSINSMLREKTGSELPYAIILGLMGVDCEHDCHTELHPVYAMAIQLSSSPQDNVWGIMVRNWGNEGFCAHGQQELTFPNGELKLFLPHKGATKPEVTSSTQFWSNVQ